MILQQPQSKLVSYSPATVPALTAEQLLDPFVLSEQRLIIEIEEGVRLSPEHFRNVSAWSETTSVVTALAVTPSEGSTFSGAFGRGNCTVRTATDFDTLMTLKSFEPPRPDAAFQRTSILLAVLQSCEYHSLRVLAHSSGGRVFGAGGPLPLAAMPAEELEAFARFVRLLYPNGAAKVTDFTRSLALFRLVRTKKRGKLDDVVELIEVPRSLTDDPGVTSVIMVGEHPRGLRYRDGSIDSVASNVTRVLGPRGAAALRIHSHLSANLTELLSLRSGGFLNALSVCSLNELRALGDFSAHSLDLTTWDRAYHNRKLLASGEGCSSNSSAFGGMWWATAVESLLTPALNLQLTSHRALFQNRKRLAVDAVGIEEFARSLPKHALVERVTSLPENVLQIVLREPIQPDTILRQGQTYIEEVPGTVLSSMTIRAFRLSLDTLDQGFPRTKAYADPDCTIAARHTNIMNGGVCQGDLMNTMSAAETEARGFAFPSIGNLVQMLRQCNLDSAYHRTRDFVLKDPGTISDADWVNARKLTIPGMRNITVDLSTWTPKK